MISLIWATHDNVNIKLIYLLTLRNTFVTVFVYLCQKLVNTNPAGHCLFMLVQCIYILWFQ